MCIMTRKGVFIPEILWSEYYRLGGDKRKWTVHELRWFARTGRLPRDPPKPNPKPLPAGDEEADGQAGRDGNLGAGKSSNNASKNAEGVRLGTAAAQAPPLKPDPEPVPAAEARYAQLASLEFDAAELAELRRHYLEPNVRCATRAPNNGRLRRSTREDAKVSRVQRDYGILGPHLEKLAREVDEEPGVAGGRKRKRDGAGETHAATRTAVLLLRALRTLRMHEIVAGSSPNLPLYTLGRLLPSLGEQLKVEPVDGMGACEVVDLTAVDDDIDVETYVVDFLIMRVVKAEPGAVTQAVTVKAEPGEATPAAAIQEEPGATAPAAASMVERGVTAPVVAVKEEPGATAPAGNRVVTAESA